LLNLARASLANYRGGSATSGGRRVKRKEKEEKNEKTKNYKILEIL